MKTTMRFNGMREDELIADRIDKLHTNMAERCKTRIGRGFAQECELRIEVLNRRINPAQIDNCLTFHDKKLGGALREACINESMWLFLHRDSPYGMQS